MQTLETIKNSCNGAHSCIIRSPLLLARSNSTEILQPRKKTFHLISLSIHFFIKLAFPFLIAYSGNGVADPSLVQEASESF